MVPTCLAAVAEAVRGFYPTGRVEFDADACGETRQQDGFPKPENRGLLPNLPNSWSFFRPAGAAYTIS